MSHSDKNKNQWWFKSVFHFFFLKYTKFQLKTIEFWKMDVFLENLSLFNHVLFMLILTNDLLNFIEIINWVFVIKVSIFGYENKVVEKVFGRLLRFGHVAHSMKRIEIPLSHIRDKNKFKSRDSLFHLVQCFKTFHLSHTQKTLCISIHHFHFYSFI